MVGERNMSDLVAASALTSLIERSPRADFEPRSSQFMLDTTEETEVMDNQPTTFPLKLMQVLSMKEYSDIIVWLPHGRAFAIVNPREFVSVILPSQFKKVKYSSFTRKLHRWGFQRKLRGEEAGSYYHELFQRDDVELCKKMSTRQCGKFSKTSSNTPAPCGPVSKGASTEASQIGRHSFPAEVKKAETIQKQLPQDATPGPARRQVPMELCVSKFSNQRFKTPVETLSDNSISVHAPSGQNKLDQLLESQRLHSSYRAAAFSRHALMMMQPPKILFDRLGDNQLTPVNTLGLLEPDLKRSHAIDIISRGIMNPFAGVGVPTSKDIQNGSKGIASGKRQLGALSLLSMMPPSA